MQLLRWHCVSVDGVPLSGFITRSEMDPQRLPENAFNRGDSFMSVSSAGTPKKVASSARKGTFERLYAHVDRRTDVLWQVRIRIDIIVP